MEAITLDDWGDFFAAQLGAAAALGGLVFVGLSLNLTRILSFPQLPNRALLALGVLFGILVVSGLAMIPGQSVPLLGFEILVIGIVLAGFGIMIEIWTIKSIQREFFLNFLFNLFLLLLSLLPYIVGGLILISNDVSGLYWVAAAMLLSITKAVSDSWVLLVEINR